MFDTSACLTNTAVLTVGINIALLVATADRRRLTTINRGRTRLFAIKPLESSIIPEKSLSASLSFILPWVATLFYGVCHGY